VRGGVGTLVVRNLAQKILFDEELVGQISDGQWENSSPRDHWQPWADAKVVVGENVGRDFYARRGYDFTNKEFVAQLGPRMLEYVRLGLVYGAENAGKLHYALNDNVQSYEDHGTSTHWRDVRTFLLNYDLERVREVAASEVIYDETQLKKDLRDLRSIVKVYRAEAA
jgi:hypothetical protein